MKRAAAEGVCQNKIQNIFHFLNKFHAMGKTSTNSH